MTCRARPDLLRHVRRAAARGGADAAVRGAGRLALVLATDSGRPVGRASDARAGRAAARASSCHPGPLRDALVPIVDVRALLAARASAQSRALAVRARRRAQDGRPAGARGAGARRARSAGAGAGAALAPARCGSRACAATTTSSAACTSSSRRARVQPADQPLVDEAVRGRRAACPGAAVEDRRAAQARGARPTRPPSPCCAGCSR